MEKLLINWLLEGDPSVRWQVLRDLLAAGPEEYEPVRKKIATVGWGKKLLSFRGENGLWDNGLYSPKWTSTTYTLANLRRLGLSPDNLQATESAAILLEKGYYKDGGINFFPSYTYSETCVTAMVLAICSHFEVNDERIHHLADHLKKQQMKDGGWNCNSFRGATHSSFHTTISALEGLREYEKHYELPWLQSCREKAVAFMLKHHLFRSHRSGKIVDEKMLRFSYPPRWRYDILRMLDYLQDVTYPYEERMHDALEILKRKRDKSGKWPLQQKYAGKTWFDAEKAGKPSRMNTLRALRVLRFYQL